MMTAESILSKRLVLRFIVALLFLFKLFSSHIYCIRKYSVNDPFLQSTEVYHLFVVVSLNVHSGSSTNNSEAKALFFSNPVL